MSKNVVFGGYDFQASGLSVQDVLLYGTAARDLQLERRADADGVVQVSESYGYKSVVVEGMLHGTSSDDLESRIDQLKRFIMRREQILDVDYAGGVRRFIATARQPVITRGPGDVTRCRYSIEFVAPAGYGEDTVTTELLNTSTTAANINFPISVGGSYEAEPDITVTISAVTGGDPMKSVRLANPETTGGVTIARNWVAGDTVVLSGRDHTIYVNNQRIYATGAFPSWEPGERGLTYSDDFASRTVQIIATHKRRWK